MTHHPFPFTAAVYQLGKEASAIHGGDPIDISHGITAALWLLRYEPEYLHGLLVGFEREHAARGWSPKGVEERVARIFTERAPLPLQEVAL